MVLDRCGLIRIFSMTNHSVFRQFNSHLRRVLENMSLPMSCVEKYSEYSFRDPSGQYSEKLDLEGTTRPEIRIRYQIVTLDEQRAGPPPGAENEVQWLILKFVFCCQLTRSQNNKL